MSEDFKTAAELKIEEWERSSLIWVLGELEAGRITNHKDDPKGKMGLDMNDVSYAAECGSVCCLGGWGYMHQAQLDPSVFTKRNQHDAGVYVWWGRSPALADLYFPVLGGAWENITGEMAADALRSFLQTGTPDWSSAAGISEIAS